MATEYSRKEDRSVCHNEKEEQKYITVDNGTSFYACDTYIKNCEKCLNQSFCLECKSPFFLLGNNHMKCFDTKPENENKYYTEDEGITYVLCNNTIEHCEECNDKSNCIKCEDNYFIVNNDKISAKALAEQFNVTVRTIERNIKALRDSGRLIRHGSARGGYWEVVSK